MSRTIHIERARTTDAKAVCAAFTSARAGMAYLPVVHTEDETEAYIVSLIETGGIMIVRESDVLAGFMHVEDGWLNHLYVAPAFQNKGLGKCLLDTAKALSPTGIQLMVFENNSGAIRFYEREGFTLVEQRNQEQTTNEEHLPDRRYAWRAPF